MLSDLASNPPRASRRSCGATKYHHGGLEAVNYVQLLGHVSNLKAWTQAYGIYWKRKSSPKSGPFIVTNLMDPTSLDQE